MKTRSLTRNRHNYQQIYPVGALHLCLMFQHLAICLRYHRLVQQESIQENLETCPEQHLRLFHHPKKCRTKMMEMTMIRTDNRRQHRVFHRQYRVNRSLQSSSHLKRVTTTTISTMHRLDPHVLLPPSLPKAHLLQRQCQHLQPIKTCLGNHWTFQDHRPQLGDPLRYPGRQPNSVSWQLMLT